MYSYPFIFFMFYLLPYVKLFKLLFSTSIYTPYTIMVKQKKKKKIIKNKKNLNIPLHKYSYPYLGQLEFSSGAFILLVDVTRL